VKKQSSKGYTAEEKINILEQEVNCLQIKTEEQKKKLQKLQEEYCNLLLLFRERINELARLEVKREKANSFRCWLSRVIRGQREDNKYRNAFSKGIKMAAKEAHHRKVPLIDCPPIEIERRNRNGLQA